MAELLKTTPQSGAFLSRSKRVKSIEAKRSTRRTGLVPTVLAWSLLGGLDLVSWLSGGLFLRELLILSGIGFLIGLLHLGANESTTIKTVKSE